MTDRVPTGYTAFDGATQIASGRLLLVALEVKRALEEGSCSVLIFDDSTGEQIEVDVRGGEEEIRARLLAAEERKPGPVPEKDATGLGPRRPGRPRLGVLAREVTLLPRHWEWLGDQPGGASVALRKLVEAARRSNAGRDRVRKAREATYRFMSAMAGNLPGFEEAARGLFAGNSRWFEAHIGGWPEDVRRYLERLAEGAMLGETSGDAGIDHPGDGD
jgi:hypothetical protein